MRELIGRLASAGRRTLKGKPVPKKLADAPGAQELDIYWDEKMANALETWGRDTTWIEIQYLTAPLLGDFLDIACGTGTVMLQLSRDMGKSVYGCDISDLLLARARDKGLASDRLFQEDATKMSFADKRFEHSYSIGSLEHFTEDGIDQMLAEAARVTRRGSFHMIPVSRTGRDEGWMTTTQSYFNNSSAWWLPKFRRYFSEVIVVESRWADRFSVGKWYVCNHKP